MGAGLHELLLALDRGGDVDGGVKLDRASVDVAGRQREAIELELGLVRDRSDPQRMAEPKQLLEAELTSHAASELTSYEVGEIPELSS